MKYGGRHSSRLVMAGVDLRMVAKLMGHKTIQMTMRYAHLAPEHNLAAVERLVSFNSLSDLGERSEGEPADSSPSAPVILEGPKCHQNCHVG